MLFDTCILVDYLNGLRQPITDCDRFPLDFLFQLDAAEFAKLKRDGTVNPNGTVASRSQIATLKSGTHVKYPPYAFTPRPSFLPKSRHAR